MLITLIKLYHSRVTLPASYQGILPEENQHHPVNKSVTILGKLVNQFLMHKIDLKICDYTRIPEDHHLTRVNEVWQILQGNPGKIMVYGAYMDARPGVHQLTIRVLGVSTITKSQPVFCQLWFEIVRLPLVVKARIEDTGRGLRISGVKYQEQLYSCIIHFDVAELPQNVSLVFSECDNSTTNIAIHVPFPNQKHELGICVVVAYGNLDPTALVEWIEFNRLLGVEEINVYDSHINAAARQVLEHYQEENLVRLHQSAPPLNTWCKWCQKLAAISTLNDCLYRNMYKYKHLMVIDFDEFLIPNEVNTIPALISFLRKTWLEEPPAYMFRNAYFFKDFPPNSSEPKYLITSRYLTRIEPSKFGYAAKSIVNPRKCVILQNHYCMIRTPDVRTSFTLNVKPEIALCHHYKMCHLSKQECETHRKNPVLDQVATRFAPRLNYTVYHKLKELSLL